MIGDKIKNRRLQLGWTQEELADKMGYKHCSSINKIEMGINDIPQSKIAKFAEVLDVSIPYLLDLEDFIQRKRITDMLEKLDSEDLGRIEERIEMLLEQDKYK